MTYRIKPGDLFLTSPSPYGATHSARTTVPLSDALKDSDLFMTVRSNLRSGDKVELNRHEHGDWTKARLIEYVTVKITQSTIRAIEFDQSEPIHIVDAAKPELEIVKSEPQLAELEIVPDPQGGFFVRNVANGHIHKQFKTEPAAKRYVTDYGKKAA